MGADEPLPRVAPLPRRGRIDTLLLEDTLDRVPPQFVAYVLERSTQSRIAPTRVLPSHPHQQADDAGHGARSPRPAFGAAIVLLRHQFAVPTQDRIWRRHRGNLTKSPASELPPQHRQSSPIPIFEAESSATELLAEQLNLFTLVFDQLLLAAAQPQPIHAARNRTGSGSDVSRLGLTIARLPLPPAPVKLSLARFQPREISHSHLARVSAQDDVRIRGRPDGDDFGGSTQRPELSTRYLPVARWPEPPARLESSAVAASSSE